MVLIVIQLPIFLSRKLKLDDNCGTSVGIFK